MLTLKNLDFLFLDKLWGHKLGVKNIGYTGFETWEHFYVVKFDIFVCLVCNVSSEQLYATNLFGHFYTLEK